MSHLIPRVSSSPPPLDDHTFGWDDDDDDFGNFVGGSLPSVSSSQKQENQNDIHSASKTTKNEFPSKDGHSSDSYVPVNGSNDDFADFAKFEEFQAETESDLSSSKPQVSGLPLDNRLQDADTAGKQIDNNNQEGNVDCVEEEDGMILEVSSHQDNGFAGKRDSTTDSGMYSTDLSPIPVSEDTTAEFGDKSNGSDVDDSMPDLSPEKEMPGSLEEEEEEEVTDKIEGGSNGQGCDDVDLSDDGLSFQTCDTSEKSSAKEEENQDTVQFSTSKEKNSDQTTHSEVEETVGDSPSDPTVGDSPSDATVEHVESDFGDFSSVPVTLQNVDQDSKDEIVGDLSIPKVPSLEFRLDTCDDSDSSPVDDTTQPECSAEQISPSHSTGASLDGELEAGDAQSVEEEPPSHHSLASNDEEPSDIPGESTLEGDTPSTTADSEEQKNAEDKENDETNNQDESVAGNADENSDKTAEIAEESAVIAEHSQSATEKAPTPQQGEEEEDWADFAGFPAEAATETPVDSAASDQPKSAPAADYVPVNKFPSDDDDDDDDDDFGDFSGGTSVPALSQEKEKPQLHLQSSESHQGGDDESDDGFGDFSAVKSDGQIERTASPKNSDAEFAAFPEDNTAQGGDDGWADFSSSAPSEVDKEKESDFEDFKSSTAPTTASVPSPKIPTASLPDIFSQCFPSLSELMVGVSRGGLEEVLGEVEDSTHHQATDKRCLLWRRLRDLETCDALGYQWSSSQGNSCMFHTLRIDTKNILLGHKKQAVPIFAANIGLLEPIRGQAGKKETAKEEVTLVNPNPAEDAPAPQEIPPVEFDWDNSGLTNPLAEAQKNSVLASSRETAKTLDLDFLVQDSETTGKSSVFQSEVLDAPRSSVKAMQPLDDILKTMKFTTTTTAVSGRNKTENLSQEAARIINSLPDLSFMQAKVLMFPLRQDN